MAKRSNSGNVENDRTLCLVKGYHEHNYPPDIAYKAGLRCRFAIVLDSYRRDEVDMFFNHELFLRVAEGLCGTIDHDCMEVEMEERERFNSFGELAKFYNQVVEIDREPPIRIKFTRKGRLVCIEETEFWTRSGGPYPYHDSYTLSFYTEDDRAEEFAPICRRKSDAMEAIVTGFHEGQPWKSPKTWRQRLFGK